MIPLVQGITRFARVPVPHTNDATYALDAQGNEWIAKREADMGCEALLAEAVTWLFARLIGVRVPDASFCDDPSERAWLSRRIPDVVHWSSLRLKTIANPAEAAAILVLDAIVFNEARHGRNLLATGQGTTPGATIWAIDADEALIGHVSDYARLDASVPDPRIHALGFPAAALRPAALVIAEGAARIPIARLHPLVEASCAIAREPRVDELAAALARRCARATTLTDDYLKLLERR